MIHYTALNVINWINECVSISIQSLAIPFPFVFIKLPIGYQLTNWQLQERNRMDFPAGVPHDHNMQELARDVPSSQVVSCFLQFSFTFCWFQCNFTFHSHLSPISSPLFPPLSPPLSIFFLFFLLLKSKSVLNHSTSQSLNLLVFSFLLPLFLFSITPSLPP